MTRTDQGHALLERAQKLSVELSDVEKSNFVWEVLGARLAAASLGLKDTRTLKSWAQGGPIKGRDQEHRLQVLYRVAWAVHAAFSPAVVAAFMRGSNPTLGDRAPLIVLADEPPHVSEPQLMAAVEALLTA